MASSMPSRPEAEEILEEFQRRAEISKTFFKYTSTADNPVLTKLPIPQHMDTQVVR